MMRVLRIGTILIFLITFVLFGLFYMNEQSRKDYTLPTINIGYDNLDVSIHDAKEDLMQGVTAYDKKDGDLTSKVIIESISKFTKDKTCIVTYAVMDSNKHVVKNSRTIRYTDYTTPEFYLKRPLIFQVDEKVDIHDVVGAVDCIEGDISDKISILATDYLGNTAGIFSLSLQATNKLGDIIYLDLPIYVEERNSYAPVIELSEYLVYLKVGEKPAFENYVTSVKSNSQKMENYNMLISSNVDHKTPGTYAVHYHVEDASGRTGHSVLTVVVRG